MGAVFYLGQSVRKRNQPPTAHYPIGEVRGIYEDTTQAVPRYAYTVWWDNGTVCDKVPEEWLEPT